jgi:hypothetical protein
MLGAMRSVWIVAMVGACAGAAAQRPAESPPPAAEGPWGSAAIEVRQGAPGNEPIARHDWDGPTVAVLGLLLRDDKPEADEVEILGDLTQWLRNQARTSVTGFKVAANTARELGDEELARGCPGETADCIASIGADLGVDAVLYGVAQRDGAGYTIQLVLFDVARKTAVRTAQGHLDWGAESAAQLAVARPLAARLLTNDAEAADVVVRANVDAATVYLDGAPAGQLAGRALSVQGVSDGEHEVAIDAAGHARGTVHAQIDAGTTTTVTFTLR